MFGVPPNTLPVVGPNVHMDILLLGIIALEDVIQNNFWWV